MFDRLGFDGKKHNKGFRRAAAVVLAALLLVTVIRADAVSVYAAEERITFKVDDEDGREYIDRGWWELYDVYVNEPLTYYVEMYTGGRYPVETVTTYTKTGATAVFRCSENIYGDSQNLLMKAGDTCTATAVFSEPNNTLKPGEHLGFNVQIQGEKAARGGDLFDLLQEDYDIAMAEAMDQVRDLDAARRDVRRGSPDYWEKKKIYEEKCLEVLKNPCAKKQLRALGGSAGLTNRAEFASWRQRFNGDIKNGMLDDYCAATGRPRDEMYFQCVTSNSSADELAGKILPEDLDLTAAQSGTSAKDGGAKWRNDMVVGQAEGNYYLSKSTYRRIYKKDPVTPAEIEKAMQLLEELDITYVAPRMDDKYVGEFNPEAYYELDTVTQKENFGKALEAPTMTQKTIQHKAGEWYRRGDAYYAEAARVEEAAKALGLDLAEGSETYKKIRNLKSRAQGCYVEGTRQVTKTVDKYADPRNDARVARGESDLFTPKHREMQAVSRRVGSRAANEIPPAEFFRYLEKNGMDKYSFAEKMSGLFR